MGIGQGRSVLRISGFCALLLVPFTQMILQGANKMGQMALAAYLRASCGYSYASSSIADFCHAASWLPSVNMANQGPGMRKNVKKVGYFWP